MSSRITFISPFFLDKSLAYGIGLIMYIMIKEIVSMPFIVWWWRSPG
jgi:hypothetical protein